MSTSYSTYPLSTSHVIEMQIDVICLRLRRNYEFEEEWRRSSFSRRVFVHHQIQSFVFAGLTLLLRPRVNFTNYLRAVFTRADPKSTKNSQVQQLFALSGSALVKAACNHVGEIDPSLCKYTILV